MKTHLCRRKGGSDRRSSPPEATSFFEDPETGKIYRHILDPRTGYPAQSGLSSVSIITTTALWAMGSPPHSIMGLEQATEYWRSHADSFEAILISDD